MGFGHEISWFGGEMLAVEYVRWVNVWWVEPHDHCFFSGNPLVHRIAVSCLQVHVVTCGLLKPLHSLLSPDMSSTTLAGAWTIMFCMCECVVGARMLRRFSSLGSVVVRHVALS